jgi:class 3 adenylate cyclase
MDAEHLGSGNRICSVVFVDIVRYSEEPVSEQVEMKARFNTLLAAALEHTPAADRLVVDAGDGAALCFLGDPEDALFAANSLRNGVLETSGRHELRFRLGINLGPVRVVKDVNGHTNVIGDGINVAQRVMSFAEPNQILVSRSYYEVVSRLSPEYAQLFQYAGLHHDKHVRQHEVYEVQLSSVPGARAVAPPPHPAPASQPPPARPGVEAGPRAAFEPALIARVTSALAREIGPVAKLIVRRTVERAADARTLCQALAEHVPDASRGTFLAGLADLVESAGSPTKSASEAVPPAPPAPRSAGPAREIGPDVLARAEQLLTRHIGPVARVLVRQAAKQAQSPHALFESLGAHIENAEVRKAFLAEAGRASR